MDNITKHFADLLSRNSWMLLLRGLVAIAFGVLSWVVPGISLTLLVLLFGAFALVDGILGFWMAISGHKEYEDWWVLLVWGVVGTGVGVMTFLAPGITELVLLFFIAVWAISTGVLEIVAAFRLRREIKGEWLLILGGLLSVIFGALLMVQPGTGALALIWLIGLYGILFGTVLVILAFKTRRFVRDLKT